MGNGRSASVDIFSANSANIWSFRQSHPELVIKDCRDLGFTEEQLRIVRQSMLVRGVNKWLKVRRDLIAYKKQIKHEIQSLNTRLFLLKKEMAALFCAGWQVAEGLRPVSDLEAYYRKRIEYQSAKERLKFLTRVRAVLKGMCKTDRWQIWEGKKLRDMNTLWARD